MLIATGTLAMPHGINLLNAGIEVKISTTDKPEIRFQAIDIEVGMPSGLSASDRKKLERAVEGCPIKHSHHQASRLQSTIHTPIEKPVAKWCLLFVD